MLFEHPDPIDTKAVTDIVKSHWFPKEAELELKLIKMSQNSTFSVTNHDCIVRVTVGESHRKRIEQECQFLKYLSTTELQEQVCAPIEPCHVFDKGMNVVVTRFAKGRAPEYTNFEWMNDSGIVHATGAFLGRLHKESEKYKGELQEWANLHNGVMKDVQIDERDHAMRQDKTKYGANHR